MSNYFLNDSFSFIGFHSTTSTTTTTNQPNSNGTIGFGFNETTTNNFINDINNGNDISNVSLAISSSSSSASSIGSGSVSAIIDSYSDDMIIGSGGTGGGYNSDGGIIIVTPGFDDNFTSIITELPNSTADLLPLTNEFNGDTSLSTVIPLTIIYLVIFISGVLGNVITCVVISRNKSMHTATNYYLFSLAISDLLVLIAGLPFETYIIWNGSGKYPFDTTMCVLHSFVCEFSANASVLTITAFTIERYVAICKPFLSHTMSKLSRAVKLVLIIWMLAVFLAILPAQEMGVYKFSDGTSWCTTTDPQRARKTFTISLFLVFILPMLLISVLYVLIGLQLRKSKIVNRGGPAGSSVRLKHRVFRGPSQRTIVQVDLQNECAVPFSDTPSGGSHYSVAMTMQPNLAIGNGGIAATMGSATTSPGALSGRTINCNNDAMGGEDGRINFSNKTQSHATRHVVNMLVAVVVAFFICWGFYHAQRLFAVYVSASQTTYKSQTVLVFYTVLTNVSGILYYFSTCVNPFLYNIMSHKFRAAFKGTIGRYFYHGDEPHGRLLGRMGHNISQRSNSFHSQSLNNTCSSILSAQAQANNGGGGGGANGAGGSGGIGNGINTAVVGNGGSGYYTPLNQQPRYPLVVSFRKIPPRDSNRSQHMGNIGPNHTVGVNIGAISTTTTPNGGRLPNNNYFNINDYEQMMRQRTNTLDTIYVTSSATRPNVCYSINETFNPTYDNDTDTNSSPQQQQRQPLMGASSVAFHQKKGKWYSQGLALSPQPISVQSNNNDDIIIERYSSPTFDPNRYFQTRTSRAPLDSSDYINYSPYDSPELSTETRRFQENLNNILKDLVFKGEKINFDSRYQLQSKLQSNQQRTVEQWLRQNKLTAKFEKSNGGISKSSSMPCFFRT